MTTESRTAKTAAARRAPLSIRPLNLPTAERIRGNQVAICRDQIIGAAKAGKDESLDYWLTRYVELAGSETPPPGRTRSRPARSS
jgi:hypothetical protein